MSTIRTNTFCFFLSFSFMVLSVHIDLLGILFENIVGLVMPVFSLIWLMNHSSRSNLRKFA